MGRPLNEDIEKLHLKESKSFNDIIYHYSRLLIFLKIKETNDPSSVTLHLTNQEREWMS